jgi:hypothetical protein
LRILSVETHKISHKTLNAIKPDNPEDKVDELVLVETAVILSPTGFSVSDFDIITGGSI